MYFGVTTIHLAETRHDKEYLVTAPPPVTPCPEGLIHAALRRFLEEDSEGSGSKIQLKPAAAGASTRTPHTCE